MPERVRKFRFIYDTCPAVQATPEKEQATPLPLEQSHPVPSAAARSHSTEYSDTGADEGVDDGTEDG